MKMSKRIPGLLTLVVLSVSTLAKPLTPVKLGPNDINREGNQKLGAKDLNQPVDSLKMDAVETNNLRPPEGLMVNQEKSNIKPPGLEKKNQIKSAYGVKNMNAAAPVEDISHLKVKPVNVAAPIQDNSQLKFKPVSVAEKDKLALDQLKPVDHMDAVKMEQDGHMNKEYHKELFLGNHEQIDGDHEEQAVKKLIDVFLRVDSDKDGLLSEAEMESWILHKMKEHFGEALQENDEIFKHLDPDGNGKVHWKEYYTHFLLAKGYPLEAAQKHVMDYDQIELEPKNKEELIHYKFRWSDADTDPVDNELTKKEFLAFRHPEQSDKTLDSMVHSIMNSMDTNEDKILTEEEFVALPVGEVEGEDQKNMDANWQKERRREFRESIDKNKDGEVIVEELKSYLDPSNPVQALMEARNLISTMDEDKDGKISKDEVMKHKDIFLSSKVVDFAANVHDEF